MKKTKIICSIGPMSVNPDVMEKMVYAGMNVARINFSHATIEERNLDESLVRRANEELGANIGILYDTTHPCVSLANTLLMVVGTIFVPS